MSQVTALRPKNDTALPSPTTPETTGWAPETGRRSARLVNATRRLLEALLDWFLVIFEELRANPTTSSEDSGSGWVDQEQSPLGRRRHCDLVRKGDLKGHKVGKRVLVRREDLDRYIESQAVEAPAATVETEDTGDEIDRNLTRLGFTTKESKR